MYGVGGNFFQGAKVGGMWKAQFFGTKLGEYQHGRYYKPPVILIKTLWKFLEMFSGSMTRVSEGLEWVGIFFWEPGVVECENASFLAANVGNTIMAVTTSHQ